MFAIPMRPRNLPAFLPDIRAFLAQPKYDGWYVVFKGGRAYTRTGQDITGWACWSGRELPVNAVGELMHVDGRSRVPSLATSATGLRVVLFDAPSDEPIEDRIRGLPLIAAMYGFEAAPDTSFNTWEEANNQLMAVKQDSTIEGFVLKRKASSWTAGEMHKDWYRFKEERR